MNSYTGVSYANQIRALADCLELGDDIPAISVIITLRETAEKIDFLGNEINRIIDDLC